MAFYDLHKSERDQLVAEITKEISADFSSGEKANLQRYFSDEDTYIRKTAYLATGKIFFRSKPEVQDAILRLLEELMEEEDFRVRQSVINAAGEIGILEFDRVQQFFDRGLFDKHHSPRNAVIGSVKKMGQKNPRPVLRWAENYLHHPDKEIRREICHGIELRGRTHPQDILPMLRELQHDPAPRVRNTLIHVLGQIAYKKGCLQTVVADLRTWENSALVEKALEEIIDVHERYKDFSVLTQDEAREYIEANF
jgi:HEAT repeat protein